jgi:hypothetical protein
MMSSSVERPFGSAETLPGKKLGTFSRAEMDSEGVVESLTGEGEGVGREPGAGLGDGVIERIEGGGVGVDGFERLKKSAV